MRRHICITRRWAVRGVSIALCGRYAGVRSCAVHVGRCCPLLYLVAAALAPTLLVLEQELYPHISHRGGEVVAEVSVHDAVPRTEVRGGVLYSNGPEVAAVVPYL